MKFSVIYSIDVDEDGSISSHTPRPEILAKLEQTEEGTTEYSYLEGEWENGAHAKFAGILTREEFEDFLQDTDLVAERTETGGSLGAPGFGFGWAPAISFNADHSDAIVGAYVTPIPELKLVSDDSWIWEDEGFQARAWRRIREAVIEMYR